MKGLPPVPPNTGCFGIERHSPAGISTAVAVVVSMCWCVPFTLFWNVIWTPSPANASSPERVIVGPGELSHPDEAASTWTATGIGTSALTDCFPIESPAVQMVDAKPRGTKATENAASPRPSTTRPTMAIWQRTFPHLPVGDPTPVSGTRALGPQSTHSGHELY